MSENQEFWEKYHKENDKPNEFINDIKLAIKELSIKSVLEIGCGLGYKLNHFKNIRAVGIDISQFAINEARKKLPNLEFHVGSVLDIPLKESFDLVCTSAVIEHIKPNLLDRAFNEMFRVSKKYILNYEAYDQTEHEIKWHRGRNEFFTVHMAKRWSKFPIKILKDFDVNEEYRLTLIMKS